MAPTTTCGPGQCDKHAQRNRPLTRKKQAWKGEGAAVISPAEGVSRSYHHHRQAFRALYTFLLPAGEKIRTSMANPPTAANLEEPKSRFPVWLTHQGLRLVLAADSIPGRCDPKGAGTVPGLVQTALTPAVAQAETPAEPTPRSPHRPDTWRWWAGPQ